MTSLALDASSIFKKWINSLSLLAKSILFYLCVLSGTEGFSQSKYLSGDYWIENYGKKEGLPESVVVGAMQDRKGYLWITTPYNLVRFDGYQFKSFQPRQQFPDLYIHFGNGIIEDHAGIFWIPTLNTGLFSFNPLTGKFEHFDLGNKGNVIGDNGVSWVIEDRFNNLWVATALGLYSIRRVKGQLIITKPLTQYPANLLHTLDKIVGSNAAFAGFSRVGNSELKESVISIDQPNRFFVVYMGEFGYSYGEGDFGWIENENGERVWKPKDFLQAGGASKNILKLDVISLSPGKYKIKYKTDREHAWNNWNGKPPERPDLWGIQLFSLPGKLLDSIQDAIRLMENVRYSKSNSISQLKLDSHDNLWILSDIGLERLKLVATIDSLHPAEKINLPDSFSVFQYLQMDPKRSLLVGQVQHKKTAISHLATLILDSEKGITNFFEDTLPGKLADGSYSLVKDSYNNLWLGSFTNEGDGLFYADSNFLNPRFKHFSMVNPTFHAGSKSSFQIWNVTPDNNGNIWVCTRGLGLYKLRPRISSFKYIDIPAKGGTETSSAFNSISADSSGNIWLGTKTDGIYKYDLHSKKVTRFAETIKSSESISFFLDYANQIVMSGKKINKVYDASKGTFKPLPIKIPDSLSIIKVDSRGNYWAKSKKNGSLDKYYILDGKNIYPLDFDSASEIFQFIRSVYIDDNRNFWISPWFDGVSLYRLDQKTKKLSFLKKYLPEGTDVWDINKDDRGRLWFGTYDDGLIRLDTSNQNIKYFNVKNGLPSNMVYHTIMLDDKIWAITDLGTAFVSLNNDSIIVNKEVDLLADQMNPSIGFGYLITNKNSTTKTGSGEIAGISRNGFFLFNPAALGTTTVRSTLSLEGLKIGAREIDHEIVNRNKHLNFAHDANSIDIEYLAISFDDPNSQQYSYKLTGINNSWVMAGKEKIARFPNLPPGDYEFYLKASNADGAWSNPIKLISFTILAPWWKTWWAYSLFVLIIIALIWFFIAYRSNWLKKENALLELKVNNRTDELSRSLKNLKAAQNQLIQSEKMASLGELTAGIAHEIQNPLNFVNNFSEINSELISEASSAIEQGEVDESKKILVDLKSNEEKIIFHGKRADAIVKSMLLHSRASVGQEELTDLNALADEYLRLSYHGLRAKDKEFNVKIETDFDKKIDMVNIVPQDIGRALLNLYNNAFYAVNLRRAQVADHFQPTVSVSTRKVDQDILVQVKDNGNGIPDSIIEKIFQPFFTTKPAGQGTGLGLSLAYDIVKSHGGSLQVENELGKGAVFTMKIPVKQH